MSHATEISPERLAQIRQQHDEDEAVAKLHGWHVDGLSRIDRIHVHRRELLDTLAAVTAERERAEPVLLAKLRCNQCNQEFDVALPSLTGEPPQDALTELTTERDRYKAEAFEKHNAMMEAMTA